MNNPTNCTDASQLPRPTPQPHLPQTPTIFSLCKHVAEKNPTYSSQGKKTPALQKLTIQLRS